MLRRKGFTLAEVLIALLLVGILSSISIQTLRNRDNSAEYEALRNKAVTNIQGVMHEALYSTMSSEIFDKNFTEVWDRVDKRLSTDTGSIKSKDGAINITTSQVMRDGVNYAYTQKEGNSHVAEITIDVNGSKAPNEEGKDIFKYNMDKFGGILLATIPDEPDKEYCPDGVTVKNSDGSNCPKCTDGSMVTTPDRSNCPKCPNGTTERNADGSNCDKCANGEMANADRSNCPKCANGQEANATRSNCPLCPDGTTEKIDAAGSNCSEYNPCYSPNVEINGCCMPPKNCPSELDEYDSDMNFCRMKPMVLDASNCFDYTSGCVNSFIPVDDYDGRKQYLYSKFGYIFNRYLEHLNFDNKLDYELYYYWEGQYMGIMTDVANKNYPYGTQVNGSFLTAEAARLLQPLVDETILKINEERIKAVFEEAKNCPY